MQHDKTRGLRRQRHLRVPVLPDEEDAIKRQAGATGLSTAAYLRQVGLGYPVTSVLDHARVDDLARLHGDLGRLSDQLKHCLDDERLALVAGEQHEQRIAGVLQGIAENQKRLHEVMRAVVCGFSVL